MTRTEGHFGIIVFILFLLAWGFCPAAPAVQFAGGTGEPNTPYQIATAEQLIAISSDPNLYNKCFVLTADLDLDPDLPGRKVFQQAVLQWTTPSIRGIGTTPFEGRFDGSDHTIRNCLFVSTGSTLPIGFFSSIAAKGVVCNLHLENVLLTGISQYCAGLAGKNDGSVVNCSVTGTIVAPASESASSSVYAGLVGQNTGLVANCHSDCDVFGYMAAGLVGFNDATGRVVLCSATGFISGQRYAGGLVYQNTGTVQYCSANGYLTSASAGGLVADNSGTIRESYATATISSTQYAGGLAATNVGTVTNCYTNGSASGTYCDGLVLTNNGTILTSYSTSGGLIRQGGTTRGGSTGTKVNYGTGTVQCVYYLDPSKKPGQTGSPFTGYGVFLSPDEMKQAASFVGFDFYGDANDGPAGHWFMPADGYPVLAWQTEITGFVGIPDVSGLDVDKAKLLLDSMGFTLGSPSSDYSRSVPANQALYTQPAGYAARGTAVGAITSLGVYSFTQNPGDGTAAKPYQISTPGQLDSLYGLSSASPLRIGQPHFILTADIDLSRYTYPSSLFADFSGEFDGNGHTIRNLQIVAPTSSSASCGLFATISTGKTQSPDPTGTVHDLTIKQAYLRSTGYNPAGILAGQNNGQILRCKATGQVLGTGSNMGGLVGSNSGQMTDCRFGGQVHSYGGFYIGGLAGSNAGAVTRCCACDVDVSGDTSVGGLLGSTGPYAALSAEACYATGTVRGNSSVGGLIGQNGGMSGAARGSPSTPLPSAVTVTVRQCYAACSVTGQTNVGGCIGWTSATAQADSCYFLDPNDAGGPNNGLGTPLTAEQLKHQASFPTWDFTDTWTICEGRDYPRLKWERIECDE